MSAATTYLHGSCLCGQVRYVLHSEIKAVAHCHCKMCQKAHGAAFGSYGSLPLNDFEIIHGQALVSRHASSPGVMRAFCSACGSPLTWHQTEGEWESWISVALGTLDTPFTPSKHRQVHACSRPPWSPEKR